MKLNFFKRKPESAHEAAVIKSDAYSKLWQQHWDRSHSADGIQDDSQGGGISFRRMSIAGSVFDSLFGINRRTEAAILQADPTLGPQKIFLLRLFRPLIITLSYHDTSLLRESDFTDADRHKLVFDPVQKVAYPAPKNWDWREIDRTHCEQLLHSKVLIILVNEFMRILRTELVLSVETAPELAKYLTLRNEEEMNAKVLGFQQYEVSYYVTKYFQISIKTEAEKLDEKTLQEKIEAAEAWSYGGRLSVQSDMRRYPISVVKKKRRSASMETRISAELKLYAPELLPRWKTLLQQIGADYPAPGKRTKADNTTDKTDEKGDE